MDHVLFGVRGVSTGTLLVRSRGEEGEEEDDD